MSKQNPKNITWQNEKNAHLEGMQKNWEIKFCWKYKETNILSKVRWKQNDKNESCASGINQWIVKQ